MIYLQGIILAVFIFTFVSSQTVPITISVRNSNGPDVYKNKPLEIECSYTLADASSASKLSIIGLKAADIYAGCSYASAPPGQPRAVSDYLNDQLPFEGEVSDSCKQAYESLSTTGAATVSFTLLPQTAGDYRCAVWGDTSEGESAPFTVNELLEIPGSPVDGTIADGASFYEGSNIDFKCSSTGGVPAPVWNYTRDGEYVGSEGITFVGSRTDGQVILACDDTSHENWAGDGSLVSYSATINVYYLYAPMSSKNMTFNPGHSYDLKCSAEQYLAKDDSLMYSWYRNNERIAEEVGPDIKVEQEVNSTADELSCRAMSTDDNIQPVTINFAIIWDVEASTPTKPSSPPPTKPPKEIVGGGEPEVKPTDDGNPTMIIVIVVVVVVVVVILIIVVVVIVRRRSHQGSAETNMKGENRAQSEDVEQATTDGAADKEEQAKLINNPDEKPTKDDEDTKPVEESVKEQKE